MRRMLGVAGTAGAIGMAGVVGVAALLPASAATATASEEQSFLTERLERIRDALSGLVDDGTITQEQADRVAETLEGSDALGPGGWHHGGRHHGHGGHHGPRFALETAADALGITETELRDALADGGTLAEVAEEQGVAVDTLVDALVGAATERLDEALADGRITQERYDALVAELPGLVEDAVARELPRLGHGRWHDGPWNRRDA